MVRDDYCDLIIPRKIEFETFKETELILTYYHTNPFWDHHIVVVPKQHIESILHLNESGLASTLFEMVQLASKELVENFGEAGVMTNIGNYQTNKHLHVHVYAGKRIRD